MNIKKDVNSEDMAMKEKLRGSGQRNRRGSKRECNRAAWRVGIGRQKELKAPGAEEGLKKRPTVLV